MRHTILNKFSDQHAVASPHFKNELKRKLLREEDKLTRGTEIKWLSWPRMSLAVVFGLILVVTALGLGWLGTNSPVPALGAREVYAQATGRQRAVDSGQYNFLISHNSFKMGGAVYCGQPISVANRISYTETEYVFNNQDDRAAYFSKRTSPGGRTDIYMNYSDQTANRLKVTEMRQQGMGETPLALLEQNQLALVDENGHRVTDNPTPATTEFRGHKVYRLLVADSVDSEPAWVYSEGGCGGKIVSINELLIDTSTFDTIRIRSYARTVAAQNLVEEVIFDSRYQNVSFQEALAQMQAAGFDLNKAKANKKE